MSEQNKNGQENSQLAVVSQRFVSMVEQQFVAEMGSELAFTDYEKTLAQHLCLYVDSQLKELEANRIAKKQTNKAPITWENINMRKLALDAVHRVNLGLDALIPNHVHAVPYWNSKEKKYDLDLQIGYAGHDYFRRQVALEQPVGIIYELVCNNDHFKPIKKSLNNPVESYEFEITNPFDRGEVVGGFGYIIYEDPKKNKLVLVTKEDFEKSKNAAPSKTFWENHPVEMKYKTVVKKTTKHLPMDPRKVNAKSYAYVENQESESKVQREIDENANTEFIDINGGPVTDDEAQNDQQAEQSEQEPAGETEPDPELEQKPTGTEGPAGPGF